MMTPGWDPNWEPRQSDIDWLQSLVKKLNVKGRWIAPMGFAFIKTDEKTLELYRVNDDPRAEEMIRRTILVGERAGVKVVDPRYVRYYGGKFRRQYAP